VSTRAIQILLAIAIVLLVVNVLSSGRDSAAADTIGSFGRIPPHGTCVGIIACDGLVLRAFANGTVEAYKIGSGQADWKPINALPAPQTEKK
jgi:hypothetical protein